MSYYYHYIYLFLIFWLFIGAKLQSSTGNSHWVCISSVGCLPGHVNLYDSLYDSVLSQEINKNDLLGGSLETLNPMPVQQQRNGSGCGIFAMHFLPA